LTAVPLWQDHPASPPQQSREESMTNLGKSGYFALPRGILTVAFAAGIALVTRTESAQAQGNRVADIATYQGADRTQRLIDGAKREGALTLYSVAPTEDNTALVGAFERKYGIKVTVYRASSEEIRQRVLNEYRARRYDVDLILNNSPAMEALSGEKTLQEVKSPYLADLIPSAVPPHRQWLGFCLNVLVQAYNTNLVKTSELPKSFADLVDPKWKGRIAIEADDSDWFAALVGALGEERGIRLFRDIAASNGFSVRKGHTLLTNLVSAGEVPLALTIFNYTAEQMKKKGAPIDWFGLPPVVAMPNAIALAANASRPHAAVLFLDFMLSDAQKLLVERDYVVTSTRIASALDPKSLTMMDAAKILEDGDKWQRLYTQVITGR
jgi:iron(III) transport system substrate-binding protein